MHRQKGFTLIELMVVISIIALLSAIVLASLGTSRNKAADTAIKQGLVNLRSSAELFYANNGNSYGATPLGGDCATPPLGSLFDNANIKAIIAGIQKNGVTPICHSSATAWAVSSPLKTNGTLSWCVDSKQTIKQISGNITSTSC